MEQEPSNNHFRSDKKYQVVFFKKTPRSHSPKGTPQTDRHYFWQNNSTAVKICEAIMGLAMLYLLFVDGDSSGGWTVFFIFLVLTILLHTIDEQHKEIEMLRRPKNGDVDGNDLPKIKSSTKL